MRSFNGLKANSIDSYKQLTQAFGSRFITNSKVPQPLSSLLSLSMHEGEMLKAYSDRYWEMYNEMDDNFDDVAISTFKSSLPAEHGLRKSLTSKPVTSIRQLMDWIDKYKRVEEDQLQGKGKTKVIPQERGDFRSDRYSNNRPRRDYAGQSRIANTQTVNVVFQEPVQQVLEKIKNDPFFKWPNKMVRDSLRRNQSLYCQYHQDHGHTTEDCRNLWSHLDQLAQEGKLKHLFHPSRGHQGQANQGPRRDTSLKPLIGTINVIFTALGKTDFCLSRMISVARLLAEEFYPELKRAKVDLHPVLSFFEDDKIKTIQPHDDALVITLRIRGYDVKRVMVDGGNEAKVMYPDL